MRARKDLLSTFSNLGAGIFFIISSKRFSTPSPVFPDTEIISSSFTFNKLVICFLTPSTSAIGESILLMTGIIFKLAA